MTDLPTKHFNPEWRDDFFDALALEIPLQLPYACQPKEGSDAIWVDKRLIKEEYIFERLHTYPTYQERTAILKPSDMAKHYTISNAQGEKIEADQELLATFFPPKAWMTDNGQERCMMLEAAKLAKGDVLVGGLGLAIYPQFIFTLKRPINSITIIENNPKVIELVADSWLTQADHPSDNIEIIESSIETYLQTTERSFDTLYLDTWDDADPRFLAHINYLVQLASSCCTAEGQIQCWGYGRMLETFIDNAISLTKNTFSFDDYYLDPALEAYAQWLKTQNQDTDLSEENITEAAREFALTTQKSLNDYNRNRCFSPFAQSRADLYRNMALSRKPDQ